MLGNLYVVATPIGNLSDITLRALEILKNSDCILCEDTRVTKKLLDKYSIQKPVESYHQHSKLQKTEKIIRRLQSGEILALVTDAGTPGISDPGNMLVSIVAEKGFKVVAIPGPSALTAALSVSGFPTDRFTFYGFLPHKKGRHTLLKEISENNNTSVFFESVHRIEKALEQLLAILGSSQRKIVVTRELTKKFETVYRGTVEEVLQKLKADKVKGEFVVIIEPK